MNTSKLKSYAPAARRDFIKAVTERAHFFGIDAKQIETADVQGDVAIIAGRPFPRKIMSQRNRLIEQVQREGFELTMRKVAFTWFNRFMALRYMELHNYLDHGFRVLSHPNGSQTPEILEQATHVELPGLDHDKVVELKLDGTKDAELYRMLIVAECNSLHQSMPFMFEAIDGPSELLLPDNLLHSDSLIRKLVSEIDEEDWQHIEIIGWLYQFYISEKKDEVIGKVVKSEDIPAATQLFTPNWIVKYMVQNSLGAHWLTTYPHSSLKGQMEYYIEPAEQTDDVKAQLSAITPNTLDPEELTLIDPACGSGHILVEAYELFKAIYLERGYRQRDVAKLILEKNLFGLDIDERAAQMTGFALMMKGRADDRQLFERGVKLNVMALVDSAGFDAEVLAKGLELADYELKSGHLLELKRLFEHSTTFGSLIQVPVGLAAKISAMKKLSEATNPDLFLSEELKYFYPLVHQAELLAAQYDAVVANPPYMGSGGMNASLKKFTKDHFHDAKSDLFACFINRGFTLAKDAGYNAMVTMQSWMFLSSFEKMRERLLQDKTIRTMAHLGSRAFGSISGEVVQTTSFVSQNRPMKGYRPVFFRLLDGGEEEKRTALSNGEKRFDAIVQDDFAKIPGSPLAYWVSRSVIAAFEKGQSLGALAPAISGMSSCNSDRFLRRWHEVDCGSIRTNRRSHDDELLSNEAWIPYNKGGGSRRWFGYNENVIFWKNEGASIKYFVTNNPKDPNTIHWSRRLFNLDQFYKPGVTWSAVSSASFAVRIVGDGVIPGTGSKSILSFPATAPKEYLAGLLNSSPANLFLSFLAPTLNFEAGDVGKIPVLFVKEREVQNVVRSMETLSFRDWSVSETSSTFATYPLIGSTSESLNANFRHSSLETSYAGWITQNRKTITEMKCLEEENNRLFIDAYGLADELTPNIPIEQITLTVNPAYRYSGKLTEEELWTRFRQDTMQELVSYAIGCMMGRYSLGEPGLIYANSGNEGFDPSRYNKFPADDDGIVPVTDMDWFDDDAANRVREFILAAWGAETLEENLTWLAEILGQKGSETPVETIRRYLSTSFFKDHLQTYKKRPIYWLFSSGKEKAFECLVYLHRYNESTLSRMRNEYVIPLQGKYSARADYLANEIQQASSASAQKKLQKELDSLKKKQTELVKFDEELRHYADQRISIDLDDGVKVNYGKFGKLLAEVKSVTGENE